MNQHMVRIKVAEIDIECTLNDTDTANKLLDVLPITASASTWGDEIYFDVPTNKIKADKTAKEVFEMLLKLTKGANLGALIATHNPDLAARMDRTVKLESGYLYQM